MSVSVEEIRGLSVAERLELLDVIWDTLAEDPAAIPLTDTQKNELDRRLEEYRRNSHQGSSWDEVKARLRR